MVRPKSKKEGKDEGTQGTAAQIVVNKCHCPTGCSIGQALALTYNENEIVHVECFNSKCAFPKVVHNKCFNIWEEAMERMIDANREGPKLVSVEKKKKALLPQNPNIKGGSSMKNMKFKGNEKGISIASQIKSEHTSVRSTSDEAKAKDKHAKSAGLPVGMPTIAQIKNQKRKKKHTSNISESTSETNIQTPQTDIINSSVSPVTSLFDELSIEVDSNSDDIQKKEESDFDDYNSQSQRSNTSDGGSINPHANDTLSGSNLPVDYCMDRVRAWMDLGYANVQQYINIENNFNKFIQVIYQ